MVVNAVIVCLHSANLIFVQLSNLHHFSVSLSIPLSLANSQKYDSRDSGLSINGGGSGSNSPKLTPRLLTKKASKAKMVKPEVNSMIPDIRVDGANSSASDSSDR